MKFKPGQKVVFLNEVGGGIVQSINDQGQYLVEDADGFTQRYLESQLAPVLGEDYKIGDDDIAIIKEEASKTKVSHTSHREYDKKSIRGFEVWEIEGQRLKTQEFKKSPVCACGGPECQASLTSQLNRATPPLS